MAIPPLTGFNYKKEQQDLAAAAQKRAEVAEKLQKDAEYNLRRAQEDAATTAIAAGGKAECLREAGLQRDAAERLTGEQTGLVKDALRKKKQETTAATKKAERLESLAAMDDPGRADAIRAADLVVATRQQELVTATRDAAGLRGIADTSTAAANALPDLDRAWTKNHAASISSRALEGDLRTMKADLTRLGAAAPAGAVAYCNRLEAKVDHDAHHVDCPRCHAEHGIPRTDAAKTAVNAQMAELERLAGLPNDTGLNAQQKLDYSIAKGLKDLKDAGKGKMIGVLLCRTADGVPVTLRGFSGDSVDRDDVDGWCQHIPPGGSMKSRNGVDVPLAALPPTDGTPHGVCAAPKMIQEAYRKGLTIVSIAEAWYGVGPQPHGALVASCTTCKSNLDVQLCPNYVRA